MHPAKLESNLNKIFGAASALQFKWAEDPGEIFDDEIEDLLSALEAIGYVYKRPEEDEQEDD